ncbi:MAG: hypothetical protein ACRBI6_05875 [Acidimicrobiales bacterium]
MTTTRAISSAAASPTAKRTAVPLLLAGGILLAGCSTTDFPGSAVDLIEGELADQAGFGALTADCESPGDQPVEGDTFDCTGVTEDGRTIEFTATITAEDTFDIGSTNVILPSDLGQVEALTAQAIGESIGIVLPADSVDCGAEPLIVDGDATMLCAVTDPDTGDVYDTTLSNIVLAPDDISFEYDVAESPRS